VVHGTYIGPDDGHPDSGRHLHAVDTPPDGLTSDPTDPTDAGTRAAGAAAPAAGRAVTEQPGAGLPPVPAAPDGSVLSAGDQVTPQEVLEPDAILQGGVPVEGHLIETRKTRRDWFARLDGDEPVIPAWFTDAQVRAEIRRRWLRRAGRATVLGLINGPWLGLLLIGWTFRGGFRTGKRVVLWAADRDGHPASGKQPATTDKVYDQMAWSHAERIGFRVRLLAGITVAALAGLAGLWLATMVGFLPAWVFALLALAGMVTAVWQLARAGRPETVKTLTPFARTFVIPTLTCALVSAALREVVPAATAKAITEAEEKNALWRSGFLPIPGGHKIQVLMPGAYHARALVPYENRLAAGMGRAEDCAIVLPLPKVTASMLWLYIFDTPVFSGRSAPGPIATARRTNWWEAMPCGITRTRDVHSERLWGGAWGIGGKPEQGKSELGKAVVAWSILDPIVKVMVFNLKGDPGYAFARACCHQYISASPDLDPTAIPKAHKAVKWLLAECGRRNAFLEKLYEAGKITAAEVTEELSRAYPDELGPITFVIDEIHRAFNPSDYPAADEFKADFAKAIRAVRSVAISLFWLTQLANSESVPTDVSGSTRCRVCLKVDSTAFFTQIFGQSGEGVFKQLGISEFPTGVAVMASLEGKPTKVKVFHITPKLAAIGERAHRLRAGLDLLTGQAAGQVVATGDLTDPADLLRHLLPLIPTTAPTGGPEDDAVAWLSELETVLTEREDYRGRSPGWLAGELRSRGVAILKGINRRVPVTDRASGQRNETGVSVQAVRDRLAELLTG
jgi:hypothetical protein